MIKGANGVKVKENNEARASLARAPLLLFRVSKALIDVALHSEFPKPDGVFESVLLFKISKALKHDGVIYVGYPIISVEVGCYTNVNINYSKGAHVPCPKKLCSCGRAARTCL